MLNPSLFHAARNEGIIGGEKDEEEGRPRKKARKYSGQRRIEGGNFQPPLLGRKSAENAKEEEEEADVPFISLGMGRNGNLGPMFCRATPTRGASLSAHVSRDGFPQKLISRDLLL